MKDVDLDRLLRAAAQTKEDAPAEMPFGFDTRVIALSRKNGNVLCSARSCAGSHSLPRR